MTALFLQRARGAALFDALSGAAFGVAFYALSCPWVFAYHPAAPLALLAVKGISCALAALLLGIVLRSFRNFGWLLAAALWTAGEYVGSSGFLAFPYGALGYTQAMNRPLLATAALWGVHGVTFLLAGASALASRFLTDAIFPLRYDPAALKAERRVVLVGAASFALFLALAHAGGELRLLAFAPGTSGDGAPSISALVLQARTAPRRAGPKPPRFYADLLSGLLDSAREEIDGVDLIVTPETTYPYSLEIALALDEQTEEKAAAELIMDAFAGTGVPVLLGNARAGLPGPGAGAFPLVRNSALYLEGGRVWGEYDKRRLVPFIESFPFVRAFPSARRALEEEQGFLWTAGEAPAIFPIGKARAGVLICYEDCFGPDARDSVRLGANLLVSMSSDSWSGSESAMRQHLYMAAFRAAESGLPLLRATNDGITCLIDGRGRVIGETPPFERCFRRYDVRLGDGRATPYAASGDVLPPLMGAAACAALASALITRRRRDTAAPPRPPMNGLPSSEEPVDSSIRTSIGSR